MGQDVEAVSNMRVQMYEKKLDCQEMDFDPRFRKHAILLVQSREEQHYIIDNTMSNKINKSGMNA